MSSQPNPQIILTYFDWSLARLKEAIENEDTQYFRAAALHRFRLTYEVALETIRAFARGQGQNCSTDKSCFQWAEKKHWLEKTTDWNAMLSDYEKVKNPPKNKNLSKVYIELKTYYLLLNHLSRCMKMKGK